jgi:hypothetical protein
MYLQQMVGQKQECGYTCMLVDLDLAKANYVHEIMKCMWDFCIHVDSSTCMYVCFASGCVQMGRWACA